MIAAVHYWSPRILTVPVTLMWVLLTCLCQHLSGVKWLQLRPVIVPLQHIVTLTACREMPVLSNGNHTVVSSAL